MAARKLSDAFAVLRRFDIFIRDKVIHHQGDLVLIKNILFCHFIHFMDGHRRCDIISQHQIEISLDELSRLYIGKPGMGSQDFLCHCHCFHDPFPPQSCSSFYG